MLAPPEETMQAWKLLISAEFFGTTQDLSPLSCSQTIYVTLDPVQGGIKPIDSRYDNAAGSAYLLKINR